MIRAFPQSLTVRSDYCFEHHARHMVDHRGQCWGSNLKTIEKLGYSWPKHIGGGWFKFCLRQPKTLPLDWQLAQAAAEQAAAEHDAKDTDPIDF